LNREASPSGDSGIQNRAKDHFPSVYLTTISIIQGVALGILVQNTFTKLPQHGAQIVPYAAFTLVTIMLVSYEYMWFVALYERAPDIWDAAVPFLLGTFEAGPSFFVHDPPNWWLLTALFSLVGAAAYWYSLSSSARGVSRKSPAIERAERDYQWDVAVSIAAAAYCFDAWLVLPRLKWHWLVTALLLVPPFAAMVCMIQMERRFARRASTH